MTTKPAEYHEAEAADAIDAAGLLAAAGLGMSRRGIDAYSRRHLEAKAAEEARLATGSAEAAARLCEAIGARFAATGARFAAEAAARAAAICRLPD